jgi:hypothetical protein
MSRLLRCLAIAMTVTASSLIAAPARAWGPDGHHTVGLLASKLIAGKPAAKRVKAILGSITLEQAAVWADCAKGVDEQTFEYKPNAPRPECKVFETKKGKAAMSDFVKRNVGNCVIKPGEESCHRQYHYADIAVPFHDHYDKTFQGARPDDVAAAIAAATHVLKGDPAPAPFSIKDEREALLLLAHYVGDIHQPLHVGAVYLDATGKPVNPDQGTFDPTTETRGGNQISIGAGHNLHATWDDVTPDLKPAKVNAAWVADAKAVPATTGAFLDWPFSWATDTQKQALAAYAPLTFGARAGDKWPTTLPAGYDTTMGTIKKPQLTKAGARLAQLLEALWPN